MKIGWLLASGLFGVLYRWAPLWAQPGLASKGGTQSPVEWNPAWMFLKAFGFLVLIIALIFIIVFFIRKYWGKSLGLGGDQEWFQVLARAPIYANQSVALVRIFNRIFLFGIGENMIVNLMEVEESQQLQQWLNKHQGKSEPINGSLFRSLLGKKLKS